VIGERGVPKGEPEKTIRPASTPGLFRALRNEVLPGQARLAGEVTRALSSASGGYIVEFRGFARCDARVSRDGHPVSRAGNVPSRVRSLADPTRTRGDDSLASPRRLRARRILSSLPR